MTQITDLFSWEDLATNLSNGLVRVQNHPDFPELCIVNYTEAAQFGREWNKVTKMCRGLIYNADTGEVLARPFPKIHNWDETEAPRITWDAPLYAWSNKEDGSLGIVYQRPDERLAVATRGSFASEQAIHATDLLWNEGETNKWDRSAHDYYADLIEANNTPLVEIVYPENRIVLDYGTRDELIYLGYVSNHDGAYYPDLTVNESASFDDLRTNLSRENAEGWVAWLSPYKAVKIKQADYVELHRIVTGLNRKSIWRAIQEDAFDELAVNMPDELFAWAEGVRQEVQAEYDTLLAAATKYFEAAGAYEGNQKQFALNVQEQVPRSMQGLVFSLRSGKPVDPAIWKAIEPMGGDR